VSLRLAVYGLLLDDAGPPDAPRLRDGGRLVGPATIPGVLVDLGAYPGLVEGPGTVRGELWELLDPRLLAVADRYEGYDPRRPDAGPYVRREIGLVRPAVDAWAYLYVGPRDGLQRVPGGDWRAHAARRLRGAESGPYSR